MTINALNGPLVTFVESSANAPTSVVGSANQNPEQGPSAFAHGVMLPDQRWSYTYHPGQNFGNPVRGWYNFEGVTIDQAPSLTTANNIVAAQTATAGTALAVTTANTTGITINTTITDINGRTVTGLLAIDSAMTTIGYGQAQTMQVWSPATSISRCITITTNGNDTTGFYLVSGYDIYGAPMTENVTASSVTTGGLATSKKAFKYIRSVTPNGTVNSTGVTVGTSTTIGLPMRADSFGYLTIVYNGAVVTSSATFTGGITTTPATSATGDVRGTWASQTAYVSTSTLQIFQNINPANTTAFTGIVGVTQA